MTLDAPSTEAIRAALHNHANAALQALEANTLDDARAALNACWKHRVDALDLINRAEAAAREAALAKLDRAA